MIATHLQLETRPWISWRTLWCLPMSSPPKAYTWPRNAECWRTRRALPRVR